MADDRRYELEDLLVRPGTYFNPQTEVLVVVDDSNSMDAEIFNLEEFEGADWVLVSDDLPVDEAQRDVLLEEFQATWGSGEARGETPLDIDAEMADLQGASTPVDEALRDEVRQLVVARNERRMRRGDEPLDVESEVERQLRDLT